MKAYILLSLWCILLIAKAADTDSSVTSTIDDDFNKFNSTDASAQMVAPNPEQNDNMDDEKSSTSDS